MGGAEGGARARVYFDMKSEASPAGRKADPRKPYPNQLPLFDGEPDRVGLTIKSLVAWSGDDFLALRRAVDVESVRRDLVRDPDQVFWAKVRAMRGEVQRRQRLLRQSPAATGALVAGLGTLACEESCMG